MEIPTETNTINDTEREYNNAALLFLILWADKFFKTILNYVLFTQNNVK